jgi:serine/threonine-protein kinase RIM15
LAASQKLQDDDFNTVEAVFKLRVLDDDHSEPMYRQMEGKGMLMFDRIDGIATHSMWVIKPLSEPEPQSPQGEHASFEVDTEITRRRITGPHINLTEILCRICEIRVPQWYFEKHSETCHETHKLEADIGECNDSIAELRNSIRELTIAIEKGGNTGLEYRGIPLVSPVTPSVRTGPLQLFRPPLAGKLQRMGVKKLQKRLLESLDDILQVAAEVSIPGLKENESNEPIERQRLLSPSSERKISTIRTWSKPVTEDPALSKLINDVDTLMKAKLDTVVRMQNTVRYAEKVRQESEQKIQELVARESFKSTEANDSDDEELSSDASDYGAEAAGDDSENPTSTIPTPVAPTPSLPATVAAAVPKTYQGRITTPSATSSPLALATPIVPSSPLREEATLELPETAMSSKRVSNRPSLASLGAEPRLVITPPATPSHSGANLLHRRHSSAAHKAVAAVPTSPRIGSVPPSARTWPSSIKDFEIIKPISKGAFGSVFLAKKKVTGDYYAIKVLKKSDMIAKNQITNVKAERMILMKQSESPFVVKLFWTFQSRDNLYLVMEYLNGGDCAALIKVLGCLPEEWTRNYIAEVVLGLEYLHERGVTHRYVVFPSLELTNRATVLLSQRSQTGQSIDRPAWSSQTNRFWSEQNWSFGSANSGRYRC